MNSLEELKKAGMNVNEFLDRIMGNTALVKLFVKKFVEDTNYNALVLSIENGDMKAAEMHCHTLKGMCGNMSLTGLFDLFYSQLALFRSGSFEEAIAKMQEISPLFEEAITNMKLYLEREQ